MLTKVTGKETVAVWVYHKTVLEKHCVRFQEQTNLQRSRYFVQSALHVLCTFKVIIFVEFIQALRGSLSRARPKRCRISKRAGSFCCCATPRAWYLLRERKIPVKLLKLTIFLIRLGFPAQRHVEHETRSVLAKRRLLSADEAAAAK